MNYEVNMLTIEKMGHDEIVNAIKTEFDYIRLCQGMIKPFGFQAREVLDRFIALSLRKFLCDDSSMLKSLCPDFKMPPLCGRKMEFPGENEEMKLIEIHPYIHIKPQNEWISIDNWLDERVAWIEKGADGIPEMYRDSFFREILSRCQDKTLEGLFVLDEVVENGKNIKVRKLTDPINNRQIVYDCLKKHGYYDLSIRRMIKFIADKQGAHLENNKSMWIHMANSGNDGGESAISVFATHMIYAATKQIKELKDYYIIEQIIETL